MNARNTPSFAYLAGESIAYAHTVEHGRRAGLTEDQVRAAIGHRLAIDTEAGRATDWVLLCDHLTVLASEKSRKDNRSMTDRDYEQWVLDGKTVQARFSTGGGVRAEGTVIAFVAEPTLVIRTGTGEDVHWLARLTEPVELGEDRPAPQITIADRSGGHPR